MKRTWFRRYWYWVVIAVFLIASGALISVFDSCWFCQHVLKFFNDWSVALSAGAAVILAMAAFLTIRNSNEREKRHREEELAKENRDRRERWLNEIIEWAVDIKKCLYSTEVLGKPQKNLYAITHLKITAVIAKRRKIETIAQKVFGDELFKYVGSVESSVAQYQAGIRLATGLDEGILIKTDIRDKIKQAQKQGWQEIDTILSANFQQPVISSTTDLIEKCSQLITQL